MQLRWRALLAIWQLHNYTQKYLYVATPAVVAGLMAWLIATHVADHSSAPTSPLDWPNRISKWHFSSVAPLLISMLSGAIAGVTARKFPIEANLASSVGVATILFLTSVSERCDPVNAIFIGLMIAFVTAAAVVCTKIIVTQSQTTSPQTIGINSLIQLSILTVMGCIGFVAIFSIISVAIDKSSISDVLAFVGIGVTSASNMSNLRRISGRIALCGSIIAFVGAYFAVQQSIDTGDSVVKASHVMIVAGALSYAPLVFLLSQTGGKWPFKIASLLTFAAITAIAAAYVWVMLMSCEAQA